MQRAWIVARTLLDDLSGLPEDTPSFRGLTCVCQTRTELEINLGQDLPEGWYLRVLVSQGLDDSTSLFEVAEGLFGSSGSSDALPDHVERIREDEAIIHVGGRFPDELFVGGTRPLEEENRHVLTAEKAVQRTKWIEDW